MLRHDAAGERVGDRGAGLKAKTLAVLLITLAGCTRDLPLDPGTGRPRKDAAPTGDPLVDTAVVMAVDTAVYGPQDAPVDGRPNLAVDARAADEPVRATDGGS